MIQARNNTVISALFPAGVVTCETRSLDGRQEIYPVEEALMQNVLPKRRNEFRAGRYCMRVALSQLSVFDHPVLVGEDRAPVMPYGVIGTISHTDGYCGVAVARKDAVMSIGLDAEKVCNIGEGIARLLFTQRELSWIAGLPKDQRNKYMLAMFSAKESIYKCRHELTRRWIGFHSVSIIPSLDSNSFRAEFVGDVENKLFSGLRLAGRYLYDGSYVFTAVSLFREAAASGLPGVDR